MQITALVPKKQHIEPEHIDIRLTLKEAMNLRHWLGNNCNLPNRFNNEEEKYPTPGALYYALTDTLYEVNNDDSLTEYAKP